MKHFTLDGQTYTFPDDTTDEEAFSFIGANKPAPPIPPRRDAMQAQKGEPEPPGPSIIERLGMMTGMTMAGGGAAGQLRLAGTLPKMLGAAGLEGAGAGAGDALTSLVQGKMPSASEVALSTLLGGGGSLIGSGVSAALSSVKAARSASQQLKALIDSHEGSVLTHQGSINELAPQIPDAQEAAVKASKAAEAKAVETAKTAQQDAVTKAQADLDKQIAKASTLDRKFMTQQQKLQTALKPENLDFEARAANPHTEGTSSWTDFNKKYVVQQKIELQNQLDAAKIKYADSKATQAAFVEKLKEDAATAKKAKVEPDAVKHDDLPEHQAYNELKARLSDARKGQADAKLGKQWAERDLDKIPTLAKSPLGAIVHGVGGPVGKAAQVYMLYRLLSGQGQ